MKLSNLGLRVNGGVGEVSFRVEVETGEPRESWIRFRLPAEILGGLPLSGDFALPLALLPAMKRGEDLSVEWPVCSHLLSKTADIQDIYKVWGYARQRVNVKASEAEAAPSQTSRGVACFFTGGVDSWYTLLKHRDEITHLVYVQGFDVALSDQWRREKVAALVRRVAGELGKTFVEMESDVRVFSNPMATWDDYHGAALGAVALLMGNAVHKVYIPGTFTYADLVPLGSHPILDPLWSTTGVNIAHDGCEASRLDKILFIAGEPLVCDTLRVCWKNVGQELNCGVCEKCLRTMICLETAGLSCATFPKKLDLAIIERLELNARWRVRYEQLRVGAEKAGKQELAQALGATLRGKHYRGLRGAARPLMKWFKPQN